MDAEERFKLITRNLQEVITEEELKNLLKDKKEVSVYWGTMPTGSPHIAYFFPLIKIADFLKAGLKVKILIADLHAALDGVPWTILEKRFQYYDKLIRLMLKAIDVDMSRLEFVKGSDFELKPEYFNDVLKMSTFVNANDCIKAASEVVKQIETPKLAGMIYPIMQSLDEEYLKVDMQFGGLDQRKIFVFARENMPDLGYKKRVELMNPMVPGLVGKKMSSSVPESKIDMMDDEAAVEKKINKADCIAGDPDNGLMQFAKYVIFTVKQDKKQKLAVERPEKYGGNAEYATYDAMEKDFVAKTLHPMDMKKAIAKEINALMKPVRDDKNIKKLHEQAYGKNAKTK